MYPIEIHYNPYNQLYVVIYQYNRSRPPLTRSPDSIPDPGAGQAMDERRRRHVLRGLVVTPPAFSPTTCPHPASVPVRARQGRRPGNQDRHTQPGAARLQGPTQRLPRPTITTRTTRCLTGASAPAGAPATPASSHRPNICVADPRRSTTSAGPAGTDQRFGASGALTRCRKARGNRSRSCGGRRRPLWCAWSIARDPRSRSSGDHHQQAGPAGTDERRDCAT